MFPCRRLVDAAMLKRLFSSFFKRGTSADGASGDVMALFRRKYDSFRTLLESNSELLAVIGDMEEKLQGRHVFGIAQIRSQATRIMFHAGRMIKSLETLSGRSYPVLTRLLENISGAVKDELDRKSASLPPDYVLPFSRIDAGMAVFVGGKSANLGEIANGVGLPIPKGFAVTAAAFHRFLEANDLTDDIRAEKLKLDPSAPETILASSRTIQEMIRRATVPDDVAEAILTAVDQMAADRGDGRRPNLALRSSAVGEDSERSFAGQYLTVLNAPPENVIAEYRNILASLFSPQSTSYRLHMGVPFEDAAMGVTCLEMADAKTSGVMYSRDPLRPDADHALINAVLGLGPYAVDGVVPPDVYVMSKGAPPVLLDAKISPKSVRLSARPEGYVAEDRVAAGAENMPCLIGDQAVQLAEWAVRLEDHFNCPQDIEWAMDADGAFVILQARPLRTESAADAGPAEKGAPVPGHAVLLESGDTVCPGAGCGPAHPVLSDADLMTFPDGGVLVAVHASPRYVLVLPKAAAVVTEAGSVTGHMASLAREFNVPALSNAAGAVSVVSRGEEITVDADAGRIYRGKVPEILERQPERKSLIKETPVYRTLRAVADRIIPLNLLDPKSPAFVPENCRTVHDIMRFAHERSYAELFQISDLVTDHGSVSVKLDARLPLDLFIIDLDGGVSGRSPGERNVRPEQIASRPFNALLKGMLREDLKSMEPRPVELKGFFSVMTRQMLSPPNTAAERFGDKSYAVISDRYLNFSSRVGYHYSVLDAYCGKTDTKNYINFQFKGGAADDLRRNRRARLIRNVLQSMGFLVEVQGDRVTARFAKHAAEEIEEKLDQVGRLLIYTRQMDMLMHSEESVARLAGRFLEGKYTFD